MAEELKQHKVIDALPSELEKNSIYYVKVGDGVDIYVTNGSGEIVAYPTNTPEGEPLGFGLSRDNDGAIQLGKLIENDADITHVVDLDELGKGKLFAIGREFDNYGMMTRGLMLYEDITGIREGNARVVVRQGVGVLETGKTYTLDEVRKVCTIELDSPNTTVLTGEGRGFHVLEIKNDMGVPKMSVDGNVMVFDQDYNMDETAPTYLHEAKVVNKGHLDAMLKSVVGEIATSVEGVNGEW